MKRSVFNLEECHQFIGAANPHMWLLSADNLHEQAIACYSRRGGAKLTFHRPGFPSVSWDGTNRSTFLLGAFALENAIKAFLVYENPHWIEGGFLSAEICSHKLVELSEKSSLIPFRTRDCWVLAAFEAGNESWMRYLCGRRADDMGPEPQMHGKLWGAYRRVMRGYGRKLVRLLHMGWTDPHGEVGCWRMAGDWLS